MESIELYAFWTTDNVHLHHLKQEIFSQISYLPIYITGSEFFTIDRKYLAGVRQCFELTLNFTKIFIPILCFLDCCQLLHVHNHFHTIFRYVWYMKEFIKMNVEYEKNMKIYFNFWSAIPVTEARVAPLSVYYLHRLNQLHLLYIVGTLNVPVNPECS